MSVFFAITCFYAWWDLNNAWTAVFWACYKNLMIVACLYFLYSPVKLLYTDKVFIGGAIITNMVQAFMYVLCPLSTEEQKQCYFDLYAWFVFLVGAVCITLYIKEIGERIKLRK